MHSRETLKKSDKVMGEHIVCTGTAYVYGDAETVQAMSRGSKPKSAHRMIPDFMTSAQLFPFPILRNLNEHSNVTIHKHDPAD